MRRRDFIALLGGAATVWPLASAAQQSVHSKRLAIFSHQSQARTCTGPSGSKFSQALFTELRRLGQIEGQNLKVEAYGREQNTSGPEALATEIVRTTRMSSTSLEWNGPSTGPAIRAAAEAAGLPLAVSLLGICQRSWLSGGGREHLPQRCRWGDGR